MLQDSAAVLATLWPRLQKYAFRNKAQDPLFVSCEAGAAGNEAQAVACLSGWRARVPKLTALVSQIRAQLWETFPNKGAGGEPYSGSYWNVSVTILATAVRS